MVQLPRALQILHGNLQRKQWVPQLVRQSPGQFPPGGNPFRLQQPLLVHSQRAGHVVKCGRQLSHFIVGAHINARVPSARRHFTRPSSQFFHRLRNSRRKPPYKD